MPRLHLPVEHSDADLVLAANLAEVVGSDDLYVAWSHETGPGAVPEVDAVLVDERPPSPFAEFFAALAGICRALFSRPADPASSAPPADPAKRAPA
jgi:hypothetical protein